jgi:hypothetical protein
LVVLEDRLTVLPVVPLRVTVQLPEALGASVAGAQERALTVRGMRGACSAIVAVLEVPFREAVRMPD